MKDNHISLTNRRIKTFEGTMEVTTNVLLFKEFMSYYLQIPSLSKRWTMKSPEKSVNDYIFRVEPSPTSGTSFSEGTPETKLYEYVKINISPTKKVDMIQNTFAITFVGNDTSLLVPFIASIIALIVKLENIHFYIGSRLDDMERLFIQNIQQGSFEIERQTESFCSFRTCKKKAFITAFTSFILRYHQMSQEMQWRRQDSGSSVVITVDNAFTKFPINYRPLAVHYPKASST